MNNITYYVKTCKYTRQTFQIENRVAGEGFLKIDDSYNHTDLNEKGSKMKYVHM